MFMASTLSTFPACIHYTVCTSSSPKSTFQALDLSTCQTCLNSLTKSRNDSHYPKSRRCTLQRPIPGCKVQRVRKSRGRSGLPSIRRRVVGEPGSWEEDERYFIKIGEQLSSFPRIFLSTPQRHALLVVGSMNGREGRDSAKMKDEGTERLMGRRAGIPALEQNVYRPVPARENLGSESQQFLENDEEEGYIVEERGGPSKKKKRYELFGVEMSPDTIAIAMVYFVQGILGLSRLAVNFFLKDDLHLDPAETALLAGFSALPWLIKPLYGFISDGVPLFGYRRRSYLVLCGLLGTASWLALATLVGNKYTAVIMILLGSLSVAFSDVVVDSMVVERARGESQGTAGSLQSLCWGSSAAGGIVSAYFSGYLVETYGVRFVFGVTALLPLITSAVAGLVHEEPSYAPSSAAARDPEVAGLGRTPLAAGFLETSKSQLGYLWETVKEPNIFLPTLFIFLWQATPTSDTAMFFFTTNKLGFGPEFLGRVRLVTSVASLVGVGVYNGYLRNASLRKVFLWSTILGTTLGLTQLLLVTGMNQSLGISDEWFAMGDSLVLTVLGQVSFMPILVLAARLCPPGVEATLFATLMSISNGAGVTGGLFGAGLTQLLGVTSQNFQNLALLLVLCNVSSLLPLPFLGLLPSETELEAAVEKAEKSLASMEGSKKE